MVKRSHTESTFALETASLKKRETIKIESSPDRQQISTTPKFSNSDSKIAFVELLGPQADPSKKPASVSSTKDRGPFSPGDPKYPRSFTSYASHERKLAAYLGFDTITKLHDLMTSFRFLEYFNRYREILAGGTQIQFRTVVTVLSLNKKELLSTDMDKKWPLRSTGPDGMTNRNQERTAKKYHCAKMLFAMEDDFKKWGKCSKHEAACRTEEALSIFSAKTGITVMPAVDTRSIRPLLGPHSKESHIEPFNRCWNLLRCMDLNLGSSDKSKVVFGPESKSRVLPTKKSNPPFIGNAGEASTPQGSVDSQTKQRVSIPHQPQKSGLSQSNGEQPSCVQAEIQQPKETYMVRWDRRVDRSEVAQHLRLEENRPSTIQWLNCDLMQCSRGLLKDLIRRAFDAERLGLDISALYMDHDEDTFNLLCESWTGMKRTFQALRNSELRFTVSFKLVEISEGKSYPWESIGRPEAIADHVDGTGDKTKEVHSQNRENKD